VSFPRSSNVLKEALVSDEFVEMRLFFAVLMKGDGLFSGESKPWEMLFGMHGHASAPLEHI
jgi:hypothetical protein